MALEEGKKLMSEEELTALANLARLDPKKMDKEAVSESISNILLWMQELVNAELPECDVEAFSKDAETVFRKDKYESTDSSQVLANAPSSKDNFFTVSWRR